MVPKLFVLLAVCLSSSVLALPTTDLVKRGDLCGRSDHIDAGPYVVANNEWLLRQGRGSQCIGVEQVKGTVVTWHTTWSWTGVVTYPNAALKFNPRQLSSVRSIKSTWLWGYTGQNLVTNVAYDFFTSSSPNGKPEYEIMIWLARYGRANPVAYRYTDQGAVSWTTATVAGKKWTLFKGPSGGQTVFTFVPANGEFLTRFSADMMEFMHYLIRRQGLPATQYLNLAAGGTEPFSGKNAKLSVHAFSLQIA